MLRTFTIGLLLILSTSIFAQSLLDEVELAEQEVFTDLGKALKNNTEVVILDLSSKGLDAFPKEISRFRNLQILVLSDNQISEIPESLNKLKKLQILYIDNNNIESLDLSVSESRGGFDNLEEIYVGYNPLKTIPDNLKDIELMKVSLAGCKFLDLNKVFTPLARIFTLESLDLSDLNLDTIPWEVTNLGGLKSLNLSKNPAIVWDTSLRFLSQNKKIEELILQNNKLTTVPEGVKYFSRMKSIDLSYNDKLQLSEVISTLEDIKFLSELNLSNCKIKKLPKNIGNLKVLWDLDLSYNELSFLPKEIGGLAQLETFDLSYNEIQELPEEFAYLLSLETLLISHNPLEFMPEGMENMVDMKYVELPKKTLDKSVKKSLNDWFPNADIEFVKTEVK